MSSTENRLSAIALFVGVTASLAASALSGLYRQSSIGSVSNNNRLSITPRSGAFSIWSVIYPLLIVSALHAVTAPVSETVPFAPAVLIACAEVLSGIWVPLFLANTNTSLVVAAVVLLIATACAIAAVALVGPPDGGASWQRTVGVQISFALFAGWLLCAATLSVCIAAKAQTDSVIPRWTLLILAGAAAISAGVTKNPVMALPCAWALVWQESGVGMIEWIGLALCAAGAVTFWV